MSLAVGTKAPDFKLFNTDKKEISLSDFAGKNLIIQFYPAAFTGVCTAQMCESRDELSFYNNMNASVVGVSVDMLFTQVVFKEKNAINFDLLSDFNKRMIHDYDMYNCNFAFGIKGVAKRGVVVVDKEGVIQYVEVTPSPGDQVNFTALKEALEKLK
ncbi:MAG: redoxin domain-containing protein [Bacteroidota bacterium]